MPFFMLLDGAKIVGEAQNGTGVVSNNLKDKKRHIDYIYDNEGIQFIKDGEITYELIKDVFNNVVAVVSLEGAKVACIYRYDAYGNCTVLDENGNVDTNKASVGNTNPFRWKSFYYDVETNLYYANGSYYDPTTGTYLDASPIASVFDNIPQLTNLDRNAPMCNNILELASNPSTAATQTELTPDLEFDLFKDSAWFVKVHIWLSQTMYKLSKWWYKEVHWGIKLGVGIALTLISMGLAFEVGGMLDALAIFAFVALGTVTGIAGYALSGVFGNRLSLEGLGNAALDAFLASAVTAFVITSVSYIKFLSRSRPVTTAELAENVSTKPIESISVTELNHTNGLGTSKGEFKKFVADINANGIQSPIKYTEINGSKYIIDGNHRVMAAKMLHMKTVPAQSVSLPYLGYSTAEEVLWDAANYISFWR